MCGTDVPVACALGHDDLRAQSARWRRLLDEVAVARVETADGLRLVFRAEAGIEAELEALVAVENDCCAWAAWSVEHEREGLVLRVASSGAGVEALHTMFAPAAR